MRGIWRESLHAIWHMFHIHEEEKCDARRFTGTRLRVATAGVSGQPDDPTDHANNRAKPSRGWRLTWDAASVSPTRLHSSIARPERIVGVDRSKAFLSQARASAGAGEDYVAADVAVAPLGIAGIGAQPDLIYARFLSSIYPSRSRRSRAGLKNLQQAVFCSWRRWTVFDDYLKIASEVLAQYGNELFVGARLATIRWDADLWIEVNSHSGGAPEGCVATL
jgi:hypothetical protein